MLSNEILVDNSGGVRRRGQRGRAVRPGGRGRGLGRRLLPAREPRAQAVGVRWFTDFVGWLPMPDGGDREAALTADYNAEMLEQRARFRRLRDRSVFVGQPRRRRARRLRARAAGHPGVDRAELRLHRLRHRLRPTRRWASGRELRARHGYRSDERVCVVAVGGSGVGAPLLRRVLDAVPVARRTAPDLRFVVVAGPRIDPGSLPRRRRRRVPGYLPDLTSTSRPATSPWSRAG